MTVTLWGPQRVWAKLFFVLVLFGGPRVWTEGLACARQALYHLTLFALVIFLIGSHVYAWDGLDHNPIYTSHTAGVTDVWHHAQLLDWVWGCQELFHELVSSYYPLNHHLPSLSKVWAWSETGSKFQRLCLYPFVNYQGSFCEQGQ
jgi:hypothetical protein